eukprot:1161525-Pelagomonas_calceolata.AAC.12
MVQVGSAIADHLERWHLRWKVALIICTILNTECCTSPGTHPGFAGTALLREGERGLGEC